MKAKDEGPEDITPISVVSSRFQPFFFHSEEFPCSAEVNWRSRLRNHPRLVQRFHNLFWQRSLFQVRQVALQLREAAHTNNDAIITTLGPCLELRMMGAPPQSNLQQRQVVLLRYTFDQAECFEIGVLEVAAAVHLAHLGVLREATLWGCDVGRFDLAAEQPACKWVVDNYVDLIFAAAGNQFGLDSTGYENSSALKS